MNNREQLLFCAKCQASLLQKRPTMAERPKAYGRLGVPPRQPRILKFDPRKGKVGRGGGVNEDKSDEAVVLMNEELLQAHGINHDQVTALKST